MSNGITTASGEVLEGGSKGVLGVFGGTCWRTSETEEEGDQQEG